MKIGKMIFLLVGAFILLIFAGCGDSVDPLSNDDQNEFTGDTSGAIQIILNGNSISIKGTGATANGSIATITSAGTYNIAGSLSNGQIIVNTKDEESVNLILSGVNINCSTSAPINIVNASNVAIFLTDNTENYVTDGASYVFEDAGEDEPNAAIFSKSNLVISGNGSLVVNGKYNDGISSKDELTITNGNITVNSVDDGIRGKDYLVIKNGNISVNAKGDGLKSDNEEDTAKGYISIENSSINITSAGDAITAQTNVVITGGQIALNSGGGSSKTIVDDTSAKGIKAVASLIINSGTFEINSADDALHSNGSLVINGGTIAISTADDGIHADSSLEFNGGDINITKSYEGIESLIIKINNGNIHVVSSDDGINASDGSGTGGMPGGGGQQPGGQPGGGQPGWQPGIDNGGATTSTTICYLYINGGYIAIDANGDGIDSNGSIEITNGKIIVNGPTENMNGALDYGRDINSSCYFKMTGGFLVAVGSSGMVESPDTSSTQNSISFNFRSAQQAGTLFNIQTSNGNEIITFKPNKRYQSVVLSCPELIKGSSYDVYYGGSSTGTVSDSLYENGKYTPGTKYTSFTVSNVVTKVN